MYRVTLLLLVKISQQFVVRTLKQRCLEKRLLYVAEDTQNNAGFTLIEIIVVLLIIGVLSAIAAPGWLGFVNRQRVNKANDAVLSALQEAQREAKKTKRNYSVSFKNQDGLPKVAIHLGYNPPANGDIRWKTLGEDMAFQPGQFLLYTNLDSTTSNKKASTSDDNVNYSTPGSGTITFDYMGTLAFKSDNSSSDTPLKVAVAVLNPGSSTSAIDNRRCVIVYTLIGGMKTEKKNQCD